MLLMHYIVIVGLKFLLVAAGQNISYQTVLGDVPVGGTCESDDDCNDPTNTYCNEQSLCWCKDGLLIVPIGEEIFCLKIAKEIGDECRVDAQCQQGVPGALSGCFPSQGNSSQLECKCTEEAIHQPPSHRCFPKARIIGDACTFNAQCTANLGERSECSVDLQCVCQNATSVPNESKDFCLEIVNELEGECLESIQCVAGVPGFYSECREGKCRCSPDAINEPGEHQCLIKAGYIGGDCFVSSQCQANLGDLSYCVGGKCDCIPGYGVPSLDRLFCLPLVNTIGGLCQEPQQCQVGLPGNLSDCLREDQFPFPSVCKCKDEAVNEIGEDVCRRKALSVGDPCLRNAQCKANLGNLSECLLGETCVCTPFYGVPSFIGDRCLAVVNYIGGECEERQQCTVGTPGKYSDCLDSPFIPDQKICNCTEGTASLPGRHECAKPVVFIGQPCENDDQCAGDPGVSSVCSVTDDLCRCLGGYIPSPQNDDCLPIRNQIGDSCMEAQQCHRGIPGPLSICEEASNICNCTSFSVHEPGEHFCHRRAVLVGDPCMVNVQCQVNLGKYSHCVGEGCECKRNAKPSSDMSKCIVDPM